MDKNSKKIVIIAISIIAIMVVAIIVIMNIKPKKVAFSESYSITEICDLATLKCYYHDVAEYESDAKGLFNIGYKKYWIEYSGIVKMGVKAKDVQINEPTKEGVIKVYVPEAQVLGTNVEQDTIQKPITEKGMFTTIKTEEKLSAFVETQKAMEETAKKDTALLEMAKKNAKEIIENYLITIGEQLGERYTVEFVDKPLNNR